MPPAQSPPLSLPTHRGRDAAKDAAECVAPSTTALLPDDERNRVDAEKGVGAQQERRTASTVAELVDQLHARTPSDQYYALVQLKNLSSADARNKDTIRQKGAVPPTVGLLGCVDAQVKQSALYLLRSLSVNEANQTAIAEAGAIPLLFQCLRANDATLQLNAAATLWNLAVDANNKASIGDTGGVSLLVNLLRRTDNERVRNEVCGALRNLSFRYDNLHHIARHGGIKLLVNLLWCDREALCKNAAVTLNMCMQHPVARAQIEREQCIPQLLRQLRHFDIALTPESAVHADAVDAAAADTGRAHTLPQARWMVDGGVGGGGGGERQLTNVRTPDNDSKRVAGAGVVRTPTSAAGAPPAHPSTPRVGVARRSSTTRNNVLASVVQGQRWVAEQERRRFGARHLTPTSAVGPMGAAGGGAAYGRRGSTAADDAVGASPFSSNVFGAIMWQGLELERKIGKGAFSDVFRAKYHGFPVAVKILRDRLPDDAVKRDKVLLEFRLLSMLRHPNVVLLMGTSLTPDSKPVFVSEMCSRGTLKDVMATTGSMLRRLKFAKDIIAGLNWLHAHNIVHRDLKCANILIDEGWTAKVSDLGLSLIWFDGVHCSHFKGNVKYAAPEILAARADRSVTRYPYGPQTDVYSFALILWELVTNQPLFKGVKGKDEITAFVCRGHRPPIVPGWPRSLQTMLTLCWEQNPARRPSFQTIQRDFEQVFVDLMCPDPTGRKVARAIWLGQETRQVPYADFERVFTQKTRIELGNASLCYRRCLCAMLCDAFENMVSFERFCTLVHYFGPVMPADRFLNAIVTLFEQPWFFGFVRVSVAKHMLLEQWRQTKRPYYMFRFSDGSPGSFSLLAIDENGQTSHRRIGHLYKTEYFVTIDNREHAFKDLHALHAHCVQVPSVLRGKHVLPGAPYQCFFSANPLRASVDETVVGEAAATEQRASAASATATAVKTKANN